VFLPHASIASACYLILLRLWKPVVAPSCMSISFVLRFYYTAVVVLPVGLEIDLDPARVYLLLVSWSTSILPGAASAESL
jgi:hypothetical protein